MEIQTGAVSSFSRFFNTNYFASLKEIDNDGYVFSQQNYRKIVVADFSIRSKQRLSGILGNEFISAVEPREQQKIMKEVVLGAKNGTVYYMQHYSQQDCNTVDRFQEVLGTGIYFSIVMKKYAEVEPIEEGNRLHGKMVHILKAFASTVASLPLKIALDADVRTDIEDCLSDLLFALQQINQQTVSNTLFGCIKKLRINCTVLLSIIRHQEAGSIQHFEFNIISVFKVFGPVKHLPQADQLSEECEQDWMQKFSAYKNVDSLLADSPEKDCCVCIGKLKRLKTTRDLAI